MMNEHEEKTVLAFVVKEKQQRYIQMLGNPQKRNKILDRLNHWRDVDPRFFKQVPNSTDIPSLLRQLGSPEGVYIISDVKSLDGRTLPLDQATKKIDEAGLGSIISCIPGKLACHFGEAGEGRAILMRDWK